MTAKLYPLIEKLFLMLLAGACGFAVTYLRDINHSLDTIREKMGIACEQISRIDQGMESMQARLEKQERSLEAQESRFDQLHPRKG